METADGEFHYKLLNLDSKTSNELKCNLCDHLVSLDDQFCQECGVRLSTVSARPVHERVSAISVLPEVPAIPDTLPAYQPEAELTPPTGAALFAASYKKSKEKIGSLNPSSLFLASMGASVVIFGLLFYFTCGRELFAGPIERAQLQLNQRRADQAIEILEEYSEEHHGKIDNRVQQLMDQARLDKAQDLLDKSVPGLARIELQKISASFSKRAKVDSMITGLDAALAKQAAAPRVVPRSAAPKPAAATESTEGEASGKTAPDKIAKDQSPLKTASSQKAVEKAQTRVTQPESQTPPPKPPSAKDDYIRYNQQLAAFFSKGANGLPEPPTFSEWVAAGKPTF